LPPSMRGGSIAATSRRVIGNMDDGQSIFAVRHIKDRQMVGDILSLINIATNLHLCEFAPVDRLAIRRDEPPIRYQKRKPMIALQWTALGRSPMASARNYCARLGPRSLAA
jgi:hypothetical protein